MGKKVTIYDKDSGEARTVYSVDASECIASGQYVATKPEEKETKPEEKEIRPAKGKF